MNIQAFFKFLKVNSGAIAAIAAVVSIGNIVFNTWWTLQSHHVAVRQKKQEQAEQVAAWLPGETVVNTQEEYKEIIALENDNHVPMYNVFALSILNNDSTNPTVETINTAVQHGYCSFVEILPPGLHYAAISTPMNEIGGKHAVPILLFTDSKGTSWIRTADGQLEKNNYTKILFKAGITPPYSRVSLDNQIKKDA